MDPDQVHSLTPWEVRWSQFWNKVVGRSHRKAPVSPELMALFSSKWLFCSEFGPSSVHRARQVGLLVGIFGITICQWQQVTLIFLGIQLKGSFCSLNLSPIMQSILKQNFLVAFSELEADCWSFSVSVAFDPCPESRPHLHSPQPPWTSIFASLSLAVALECSWSGKSNCRSLAVKQSNDEENNTM